MYYRSRLMANQLFFYSTTLESFFIIITRFIFILLLFIFLIKNYITVYCLCRLANNVSCYSVLTAHVCVCVFAGPIPLFIGSEMFRQGLRSMVMTLVGVILWLATFVIAMVFEHLQVTWLFHIFNGNQRTHLI